MRDAENRRPSDAALLNGAGGSSITLLFTAGIEVKFKLEVTEFEARLQRRPLRYECYSDRK